VHHFDIAIIGGGQAGRRAAEGARSVAPDATIVILGEEAHLPYDRPPLSKEALTDPAGFASCEKRDRAFYDGAGIVLALAERVEAVDLKSRALRTPERIVRFERAIFATGSRVRRLSVPKGAEGSVYYLRTKGDAYRLRDQLQPNRAIGLIGAGFIGLEVAAAARSAGAEVIVFEAASSVLSRVLPGSLSRLVEERHRAEGVRLLLGTHIRQLAVGSNGRPIVETDHSRYELDALIVGIGVEPNDELASECGLSVRNGIVVDAHGRTCDERVYAAGEVTMHPFADGARQGRFESWQVAELQAYCCGVNAAGGDQLYQEEPWFWSDQYDLNIQVLGSCVSSGHWVVREYDNGQSASAFALGPGNAVEAVAAINAGRDISIARRLISRKKAVDRAALSDPQIGLQLLLK
jgi:anthranilate 1,2-dioxygenase ferredoxin reductase component